MYEDSLVPRPQALMRFALITGGPGTFSQLHVGRNRSKDGCTSLPFAGDSVSVLSLWSRVCC